MTTDTSPRCWRCNRVLAEYMTRPWSKRCHRCKAENRSDPAEIALTKASGNVSLDTDK
jgi:phage FluMu protein Com